MKDQQAQPWHEADEKKVHKPHGGAPLGTHSLTGGGVSVGMPPKADDVASGDGIAERGDGAAERGDAQRGVQPDQPDPLAEPRAGSMKR